LFDGSRWLTRFLDQRNLHLHVISSCGRLTFSSFYDLKQNI
jgi:hypothetical protein